MESGHDVLVLPDLGLGKEAFEEHGQVWGKDDHGQQIWWSIRHQKDIDKLLEMWKGEFQNADPRELIKMVYEIIDREEDEQRKAAKQMRDAARRGRSGIEGGGNQEAQSNGVDIMQISDVRMEGGTKRHRVVEEEHGAQASSSKRKNNVSDVGGVEEGAGISEAVGEEATMGDVRATSKRLTSRDAAKKAGEQLGVGACLGP